VNETDEVFLECDPNGSPKPTISWYFEDTRLNKDFTYFKFTIVEDGIYISNITEKNHGTYKCQAHQSSKVLTHTVTRTFNVVVNCELKAFEI
jgi:Immunoglobulin I-set domain